MLLVFSAAVGQTIPLDPAAKVFPDRLGDFRAASPAISVNPELIRGPTSGFTSAASRLYVAKNGQKFWITVKTAASNSAAYALMTNARRGYEQAGNVVKADVGTVGFQANDHLVFIKGTSLVVVSPEGDNRDGSKTQAEVAKAFAATLDHGEGDIPVLIKHLPNWESVQERVLYATDKNALREAVSNQPILDALTFEGGAEAAVADYNGTKMALIEFNTPQIASDNDARIKASLQQLSSQGQPLPTAYRRVGNYAVFVFGAPNFEAANQLIDQVKYQQMVQWLGENPYRYDEAIREFGETTLGVFVNVVKASGLALLLTFGVGGLFGALLFTRRRAQQRAVQAYSDAGGMLRLNLDEINSQTDPSRLLGRGN